MERPATRASVLWAWSLVTVLAGTLLTWVLTGRPRAIGIDDANITMVFSANIARGHGYVFFPGQERVEGSTSLLWTAIVALLFRAGDRPEGSILGLGVVLTAASLFALYRIFDGALLRPLDGERVRSPLRLAYGIYLVTCVPVFFWGVFSMMDTSLWLTVSTAFVALVCATPKEPPGYVSALVWLAVGLVASATRPEAPVLLGLGALASALLAGTSVRERRFWLREGALLFGLVLGSVALVLLRLAYFGVPVPNTFYAKVSSHPLDNFVSGARYVLHFLLADGLAGWLLIAAAFVLASLVRARLRGAAPAEAPAADPQPAVVGFLSFWILLVVALQLLLGGDHFAHFRFFLPVIPLLPLPLLFLLQKRTTWLSADRSAAIVLIALFVGARQAYFYGKQQPIRREYQIASEGRRLGETLNHAFAGLAEKPTVGSVTVGGLARTYEGRVLDLMGLCWAEMARSGDRRRTGIRNHAAFNEEVFYRSPPDIVLARLARTDEPFALPRFELTALRNIPASGRFRSLFLPCEVAADGQRVVFLARTDWRAGRGADVQCGPWSQVGVTD